MAWFYVSQLVRDVRHIPGHFVCILAEHPSGTALIVWEYLGRPCLGFIRGGIMIVRGVINEFPSGRRCK